MNPIPESIKVHDTEKIYKEFTPEVVNREFIPEVSIVSIIYKKEREIGLFLTSMCEQEFDKNYEIILVNDNSPDKSISIVNSFISRYSHKHNLIFKIITNTNNLGNCECRNIGIQSCSGSIIIIMDADCVVNNKFINNHYDAYKNNDCDATTGYMNIDVKIELINKVKNQLEELLPDLPNRYVAQDPCKPNGFLNCVTRNFSIRKDFINGPLFNLEYNYSNNPDSGFGWEDIEMGYQLYKRGARIKFIPTTFSIHCSHAPTTSEKDKPLKSLKNFKKLIENNPDIVFIARKWVILTYGKIIEWIKNTYIGKKDHNNLHYILKTNPNILYLNATLKKFNINSIFIKTDKPLKILTYRWHCAHQYELYKSGHNFTLATGTGTPMCNAWEYEVRPLNQNAKLVPIDKINQKEYDLAILHFDENSLSPETLYTSGALPPNGAWGDTFKWFKENINIPKVAICHGTPQFYNQYSSIEIKNSEIRVIEEERQKLVNFMEDTLVILNSHQAKKEWGFKNSKVIWHGFDPIEFPQANYKKGILTLNRAMKERPHYRGYFLFQEIMKGFPAEYLPKEVSTPRPGQYTVGTNEYANAKYLNYVNTIREYSIYLNPTYRSPMPRSRGEAMMCGLVTVSANNHDVDMFIKNGINGFYSNDPNELREYLLFLLKNPVTTKNIGILSRNTAMDIFNHDRYLKEWENVYKDLTK